MKKSGFWTFCFAFIPGAGQMYHGYMRRGISWMSLFALGIALFSSTGWMLCGAAFLIMWCAAFFDTFHVAHMDEAARAAKPDAWLWGQLDDLGLFKFTAGKNRVLGTVFVVAGIWLFLERLPQLLSWFGVSPDWPLLNFIRSNVPGLAVAALLIWLGVRFIRGPKVDAAAVYRPVQSAQEGSKDE